MELEDSILNTVNVKKNFDRFEGDQPIIPEMVKPISVYEDGLAEMGENRRESNFSLQSDISIGTTGSEASMPHLRYFRTPSVVVSDHSEDTGCVSFDDIRRIHNAYSRHRKNRNRRRHSDALVLCDKYDFEKTVDSSSVSESTNSEATEYYRSSQNGSPVPRRKTRGYRNGQKSLSLDEVLAGFELGGGFRRKTHSDCSSNDLSPILSQCGSSTCSENSSRRSSTFSEVSPVMLRKHYSFDIRHEDTKSGNLNVFNSQDSFHLDDSVFSALERQRSLSYDELYIDSSVNSDVSYSDLSTDFSASSSLSNLPGTLYYSNYNPNQDCSNIYRNYKLSLQIAEQAVKSRNGNIKASKSCSDFLSVSRIAEDYPNLKHRRHSNGQVASDVRKCKRPFQKKWSGVAFDDSAGKRLGNTAIITGENRTFMSTCRFLGSLGWKSFHESLNFQKKNYPFCKRKSKSSESVFFHIRRKGAFGSREKNIADEVISAHACRRVARTINNSFPKVNKSNKSGKVWEENNLMKVVNENKKIPKKEWLSVEWRYGDLGEYGVGGKFSRKVSDCSTCSTLSGDHDISESLTLVNSKTKSHPKTDSE